MMADRWFTETIQAACRQYTMPSDKLRKKRSGRNHDWSIA